MYEMYMTELQSTSHFFIFEIGSSYQILKSATSIGANYREAARAESKADFIHKIGVVEKEASETIYSGLN